nr:MAG TPA: hypothetical protein [Caudoviricetes sp.]
MLNCFSHLPHYKGHKLAINGLIGIRSHFTFYLPCVKLFQKKGTCTFP